jgi:thioredoxin 1
MALRLRHCVQSVNTVEKMNQDQDTPSITEVGEADFEAQVLQSKQPVLVEFWAPWSRPCHVLDSAVDEVATASAGGVKIVKVNADDHPDLSLWYEVQSIPTLLFFDEGGLRGRLVGTASKEAILSRLRALSRGGDARPPTPWPVQDHELRIP